MKVWASKDAIRDEVADVPEPWLRGFAIRHPKDCRKFAAARNGAMLYRVAAVIQAIEEGEAMPDCGIVDRGASGADGAANVGGAVKDPGADAADRSGRERRRCCA